MKVNVYVDGFNLYYRALKGGPHKWLDLEAFSQKLLPSHQIIRIRYFTALVKPRPSDPQEPIRQQAYIRALRTIPNLTVHLGRFLEKPVSMMLERPPPPPASRFVRVLKSEEKGSDVNLATYLMLDAFKGEYEAAAVITNDSDLAEPIRVVRDEIKRGITVLDPCADRVSRELKGSATFYRSIRQGVISSSQFPPELTDANGKITKPAGW